MSLLGEERKALATCLGCLCVYECLSGTFPLKNKILFIASRRYEVLLLLSYAEGAGRISF